MGTAEKKIEAPPPIALRRKLRFARTRLREWRMIAKGLLSKSHPILVHIIPIRRCNLSCTYCNEFDDFSKPVPLGEMKRRLDLLADMGTSIITISGGEPLLHPELDEVIAHIRRRGMIAGLITNGYLLTAERIERLNRAGLEHLQISIDNAMPDEVSKKSLKILDQKLELLARYAVFQVNINSVLGSGVNNPEDALAVAHRAIALGFTSTVGIIHDHNGQLKPLEKKMTGGAAPARATSTSARTGWCTGVRSSAGTRACRSRNTPPPTGAASMRQKNSARPTAPSPVSSKSP